MSGRRPVGPAPDVQRQRDRLTDLKKGGGDTVAAPLPEPLDLELSDHGVKMPSGTPSPVTLSQPGPVCCVGDPE